MKSIRNLLAFMIFAGLTGACLKQSEYSVVPELKLVNFIVKQGTGTPDTLVVTINFKDGDGDIGIGAEDLADPNGKYITPRYWAYDTTNISVFGYTYNSDPAALTQINSHLKFINFKARHLGFNGLVIPDTLDCVNWETRPNVGSIANDILFVTQNPSAFNFNMDLYTQKNVSAPFVLYPLSKDIKDCHINDFRYTLPDLSDHRKISPIEGTFTIKIIYLNFITQFKGLNPKFDITITDRAGHVSNKVPARVNPL